MIHALHQLASGKLLKQSVSGPRKPGSASAQIGRFCARFYDLCEWLDAHSPSAWQEPYVAGILTARLGFIFPRDLAAAREAYARGRKSQGRLRGPAQK
jgi:hypothetical protein